LLIERSALASKPARIGDLRRAPASVYQALAQGEPVSDPMCTFDNFVDMIGFPRVWDFEKKYADLLDDDF
jgi:hypothetical protein